MYGRKKTFSGAAGDPERAYGGVFSEMVEILQPARRRRGRDQAEICFSDPDRGRIQGADQGDKALQRAYG